MAREKILRLKDNPFVSGKGIYEDRHGTLWDIREVNTEYGYVYAIETNELSLENEDPLLECNKYAVELT